MTHLTHSTTPVTEGEIVRKWHLYDADGKNVGRFVPEIAKVLQGKNKSNYVSYLDMGDYVVVINAAKVNFTGRKSVQKVYTYYSGYPGGLRRVTASELKNKKPQEIIRHAVLGMLPKNKLRDKRIARLFIYPDTKHPYQHKFVSQSVKGETKSEKK